MIARSPLLVTSPEAPSLPASPERSPVGAWVPVACGRSASTFVACSYPPPSPLPTSAPPLEAPPTGLLYEALPPMSVERYLESWTPGDSAVRRGEVYLHPRFVEDADATPYEAVESAFDVTVDSQDLAVRGGVPFLTDTATARIRSAVATSLGRDRQAALSALAESGVPRPVVEDLDVDVKVAYGEGLRVRPVDPAGDDLVPEAVGSVGAKIHFNTVEVS